MRQTSINREANRLKKNLAAQKEIHQHAPPHIHGHSYCLTQLYLLNLIPNPPPRHSRLMHCLQQFDQHVLDDPCLADLVVPGLLQFGVLRPEHRAQTGRSLPAEISQLVVYVFSGSCSGSLEYL